MVKQIRKWLGLEVESDRIACLEEKLEKNWRQLEELKNWKELCNDKVEQQGYGVTYCGDKLGEHAFLFKICWRRKSKVI